MPTGGHTGGTGGSSCRASMARGLPVRGERERVFRHLDAKGLRIGTAALEALAEQLAGQKVQGQDAAA
jgi:hypothetical protein